MNTVYGNDAGHDITAPFINGLAPSSGFVVPAGSPSYATGGQGGAGAPQGGSSKQKHGHGHG